MIRITIVVITIMVALCIVSSSSAFYEYVDKNGVTRYTDDINDVPEDQRYGKEEYQESEAPEKEAPTPAQETGNKKDAESTASANTDDKNMDYEATLKELKEKQQGLQKERAAIEKDDAQLLSEKLKLKPGDDIEEYNEQAVKLKERTAELEERREEFNDKLDSLNAEIEQYNEKVAKKLESQLQEYKTIKSKSDKSGEK